MNVLQKLGLAMVASVFVHFRNDNTGELVYLPDAEGKDDKTKPVGVKVYGPGSKEFKAAQSAMTQEAIEEKRTKITAKQIEAGAVDLMARTTAEFVNFDYPGSEDAPLVVRARAFYLDPAYVNLRKQVEHKQGDLGAFLPGAQKA